MQSNKIAPSITSSRILIIILLVTG